MGRGVLAGAGVVLMSLVLTSCTASSQASISVTSSSDAGGPSTSHAAPDVPDPHATSSQSLHQIIVLAVHPAVTTITVSSSPVVAVVGAQVTIIATLTPIYPSGTVSFTDGGIPIPSCQGLPVSKTAPFVVDCPVTYNAAGAHVIVATYTGAYSTLPATSAPYTLVVVLPNAPRGYWEVASDGGVFSFGDAQFYGSMGGHPLNQPVVGMAVTPDSKGYWLLATDGGIFAFGDAGFYGSTGNITLNQPIVGMAATADGKGYWLVARDGGVFGFGDARFYGSMGGARLNQPMIGMAPTPTGKGNWLVAADGGVFSFGDAGYYGSMGGTVLNRPVVGIAAYVNGDGYWMDASDGGVFSFGQARFHGSMGGHPLNEPVVGMAPTPTGNGYWLDASDGGIFTFGDANFFGSMGGRPLNDPMVGMATTRTGFPHSYQRPASALGRP